MKPGTQADLRKHLESEHGIEVTKQAISLLVKAKDYRIIKTPAGKIKIEETAKALVDSGFGKRSELIKRKKEAVAPKKPLQIAPTPEEHESDLDTKGPLSLDDSRERIEKHKAFHQSEKERINNEQKQKQLIDVHEAVDNTFDFVNQVKEHIQSQHDRISLKLQGAQSQHEIEQILKEDNHRALSRIAENFEDLDDDALKKKLLRFIVKE